MFIKRIIGFFSNNEKLSYLEDDFYVLKSFRGRILHYDPVTSKLTEGKLETIKEWDFQFFASRFDDLLKTTNRAVLAKLTDKEKRKLMKRLNK